MTSLLVLGGTSFVGRSAVLEGLARGWTVTTFNRGRGADVADPRVRRLRGDRTDPAALEPLRDGEWDLALDTWTGAPAAARDSATLLADRVGRCVYISSCSVYGTPPPLGATEATPAVDADPDAPMTDYSADKRGAELAVAAAFGDRALLSRPGLILGPFETPGRLLWWLQRAARGGELLAPGPPDTPLQLIDARDLVAFSLDAALAGHGGPLNVISRTGHTTIEALLAEVLAAAGAGDARLTWLDARAILDAGVEPWTDLPIWIPPGHEYRGLHESDTARAHALGLRCRPVEETVADTWAWMRSLDGPPPIRDDVGLDPAVERALLSA